ncbi:Sugar (pentulose and hexulose) kinase [Rubrobacter radiotolerans]|uniref:FGGY family carbohydrate kinase n=1 Tax=Rubrobacter radiotolerans TaxID=42256 RepID=A0A023X4T1_RUBRA|nr:FGGY family carbohydrate kinase [Rubrobacter radiotolerans]AHY47472.1 Sugar (pentulose and hexulose) kinase [Rubrobacter radiotolerans]MDX5894876.1 FGGY family carbohydrate kinase [Rubrobacter radiotolerans]SMC06972.1 xylulokinase [Rubrobacter radiotolerans DSM 5868]
MFLGIDLGTGSVKAALVGRDGGIAGVASSPYSVRSPRPGRAESDPDEWWRASVRAAREALDRAGEATVEAVGLSGQMHGVVLSGTDGEPLRPAVLWADTRSEAYLEKYRALDEDARHRLANPPAVGMAGPSLLWLQGNEPQSYRSARWALQPKDWLRLRLTGEVATEPSDASATLLYDLRADGWDREVAESLGLEARMLAPLRRSREVVGGLRDEAAGALGLPAGTPVVAGAADTAAAVVGTALREAGEGQLTVGTGAQVVVPVSGFAPDPFGMTHLFRSAERRESPLPFYALAALQNAGLALEWVRGVFGVGWPEFYREAFSAPPGSEGLVFVPHLGGERTPRFDAGARGLWSGISLSHGRAHLLRAALEGVAFSIRDGLEALEGRITAERLRLAGGGSLDGRWREMLADVLGVRLVPLPESVAASASARGAAMLAASALGVELPTPPPDVRNTVEPAGSGDYVESYARYRTLAS